MYPGRPSLGKRGVRLRQIVPPRIEEKPPRMRQCRSRIVLHRPHPCHRHFLREAGLAMATHVRAIRPGSERIGSFGLRPTRLGVLGGLVAAAVAGVVVGAGAGAKPLGPDAVARGRELFERTWQPDDRRTPGGDGLGPVFNDRSCVACHGLGGAGGGGPASKNVDVVSVTFSPPATPAANCRGRMTGQPDPDVKPPKPDLGEMAAIHPGFTANRSVVLHRFGLSPSYENWRRKLMESDPPDPGPARRTRPGQ